MVSNDLVFIRNFLLVSLMSTCMIVRLITTKIRIYRRLIVNDMIFLNRTREYNSSDDTVLVFRVPY